jgi:DNA-binding Lrp family transcriptional regulator
VIRKYVTLLDPIAVNLSVTVFVQITLDLQVEGRLEIFERAVMNRPEVLECYLMTGDADYLLRVVVPDVPSYERFLRDALTRIESVAGIKSSFSLKQVKYFTALPLTGEGSKPGDAIVRRPLRSKADAPARRRRIPRKKSPVREARDNA